MPHVDPDSADSVLEEHRWTVLLEDYEELRASERNFVRTLAALLGGLIAIAGAVALILERVTAGPESISKFPEWAWALIPLPAIGVTALFVYLSTAAHLRDRYLRELERELYARVQGMDDPFSFPSYHHLSRVMWLGWRGAVPLVIAYVAILLVLGVLNIVAVVLVDPGWLRCLAAGAYLIAWLLLAMVFVNNLGQGVWNDAQDFREKVRNSNTDHAGD